VRVLGWGCAARLDAFLQDSGRLGRYPNCALDADAGAVVTMKQAIIPPLIGAGQTWCEPRILELAMLPAVPCSEEVRPRPGRAADEHTSENSRAYANMVSTGHPGISTPTSGCDRLITEYEKVYVES